MTLSVLLMSFGSLLIALTPTYQSIGILAPLLLLLARLLQGLSVGGEYGVSATYLSEMATQDRRGFYSSFQYVTLIYGQLIALGIQLYFTKTITHRSSAGRMGLENSFVIGALFLLLHYIFKRIFTKQKLLKIKKTVSEKKKEP